MVAEVIFFMFYLIFIIAILALCVFLLFGKYTFFKKCGVPGWKAFIPFYADYEYAKMAKLHWWWVLIFWFGFGIGAVVFKLVANYNLGKMFHKDEDFMILMTLFPVIYSIFVALNPEYQCDQEVSVTPNGFIDGLDQAFSTPVDTNEKHYCIHCGNKLRSNDTYCSSCGKKI